MHFSKEKLKEQAGWIILGFVVLVALGFLGYQQLNGRVVEAQQDRGGGAYYSGGKASVGAVGVAQESEAYMQGRWRNSLR